MLASTLLCVGQPAHFLSDRICGGRVGPLSTPMNAAPTRNGITTWVSADAHLHCDHVQPSYVSVSSQHGPYLSAAETSMECFQHQRVHAASAAQTFKSIFCQRGAVPRVSRNQPETQHRDARVSDFQPLHDWDATSQVLTPNNRWLNGNDHVGLGHTLTCPPSGSIASPSPLPLSQEAHVSPRLDEPAFHLLCSCQLGPHAYAAQWVCSKLAESHHVTFGLRVQ
eukprot:360783-Chlamydomonas_euryale.AAC.6